MKVLDNVNKVSLGYENAAAIRSDGSLWVWGRNHLTGGVGDGTETDRLTPVKIMDDVVDVAMGYGFGAAVKSDGSLWTWGLNVEGCLGDGSNVNRRNVPAKIADSVSSVCASDANVAIIKRDESLWMWGDNDGGQLGIGDFNFRNVPAKVMDGVKAVDSSTQNTAVLKTDGSVWIWGWNGWGQIGNGTSGSNDFYTTPVKALDQATSVVLGEYNVAATRIDGSIWAWGYNSDGELLNQSTMTVTSPIRLNVQGLSIEIGEHHFIVRTGSGAVLTWGSNDWGQLGDGTNVSRYTPAEISFGTSDETEEDIDDEDDVGSFRRGVDNNSFTHSAGSGGGFEGVQKFSVNDRQWNRLMQYASSEERSAIKKLVSGKKAPDGWCTGIALTMSMVYQGDLALDRLTDSGAKTYFELPRPCTEEKLLNALSYSWLLLKTSQFNVYSKYGAALSSSVNPNYIEETLAWGSSDDDYGSVALDTLDTFLRTVVEKVSPDNPLVFSYWVDGLGNADDVAHSVLLTDCKYYPELGGYWDVEVYDMNSVSEENPKGEWGNLRINNDSDKLQRFVYNAGGQSFNESNYKEMSVIDTDVYKDAISSLEARREAAPREGAVLEFSANADVTITNADGRTLRYVNGKLSGTMAAYSVSLTGEGSSAQVKVITDSSSRYDVVGESSLSVSISDFDTYYSLDAANLDSASFSSSGVKLNGSGYDFTLFASLDTLVAENEKALLSVSGTVSGDTRVERTAEALIVDSESGLSDVEIGSYVGQDSEYREVPDGQSSIKVSIAGEEGEEGDEGKDEEDCPSDHLPDVDQSQWYHDAVDWALASGAMNGYDSGLFGPNDALAREQAAGVMYNLLGEGDESAPAAPQGDVVQGQWYSAAVNWAVANGVMNGYGSGDIFGVGDTLTREQFAGVLTNVCGADLDAVDPSVLAGFGDASEVSDWAEYAMAWAVERGVIHGVDLEDGARELQAGREISRAEMAAMMMNAVESGVLKLG